MNEGTLAKPQAGVAKMREVSGSTGQVGGTRETLRGGVYRHENGTEIIALDDPITGDAQARGYVRAGFTWVRDVEPGDVKEVGIVPSQDFANQPERSLDASSEELKGLRARLAALESADAARKGAKPDTATEQSQKHAQDAAERKVEERGTDNSGDVASNGGVNAPVTPPASGDVAGEAAPAVTSEISELRAKAKELGISGGGSKEELKARIADAEAGKEIE